MLLSRCCEAGYYEQAVGVAMEGRRLDKLEQIITRSSNMVATLSYALGVCQKLVTNRDFRQQVRGEAGGSWWSCLSVDSKGAKGVTASAAWWNGLVCRFQEDMCRNVQVPTCLWLLLLCIPAHKVLARLLSDSIPHFLKICCPAGTPAADSLV
jgi:hypothetical protein